MPGLMMATLFIIYIYVRCRLQPELGPVLPKEERDVPMSEKLRLLRAGILPLVIFFVMMFPFVKGWTSLVESSAIGALAAFVAAMRYDARDPKRVTVASDKAFWLHLLAAPLIVHSILALTTAGVGELDQGDAMIVIALFAALALVAVIVDRRAILVSGLGYFGVAIGTLMAEADISGATAISVTLLLLGGFILLLGSAWRAVRRTLGSPLRGTSLARLVPAFD